MRALGVAGFNVTIPHKVEVIEHLDDIEENARAAGAVNTVKNIDGKLVGFNTDGDGFIKSLADDLGYFPDSGTIAVIGAGGAARGAIAALCRAGAKRIVITNRSRENGEELARLMRKQYGSVEITTTGFAAELKTFMGEVSLVVNATSLGMNNEIIPHVDLKELPSGAKIYDMVYSVPVTPLLSDAAKLGLKCANGLGMLSAQGERSFRIWTGMEPPQGLMKSVLMGNI